MSFNSVDEEYLLKEVKKSHRTHTNITEFHNMDLLGYSWYISIMLPTYWRVLAHEDRRYFQQILF